MDIKEKIKRVIETSGPNHENLRDLFDAVRLYEDPQEKREWLLYVRQMCRGINDEAIFQDFAQNQIPHFV